MNPDDLKLFDQQCVIKFDAFAWALVRRLADLRAARKTVEAVR